MQPKCAGITAILTVQSKGSKFMVYTGTPIPVKWYSNQKEISRALIELHGELANNKQACQAILKLVVTCICYMLVL